MDCGFYTVSLLAALACMGLAAWVLEWYSFVLLCHLRGRLRVDIHISLEGLTPWEQKRMLLWARRLCALRFPGAWKQEEEGEEGVFPDGRDNREGAGEDPGGSGYSDL